MHTNTQIISTNQTQPVHWIKILNALFLIAGTCIGGGMLALPILSSQLGFWPSITTMFIACIFMTITGLFFLEATLWVKKETHVISLSKALLGKFGQVVCWGSCIFIFYTSLVAYTAGSGKEISFVSTQLFSVPLSDTIGSVLFFIVFWGVIYVGYYFLEKVNLILFVSMMVAYVGMLGLAPKEINFGLLERQSWNPAHLLFLMPIMLATFSFPGIVPTIVPYLNRNVKAIRVAIIGGTTLTFIVYFLWLFIVLGTIPHEGPNGLHEAYLNDISATESLHYTIQNPFFSYIAQFFAFFALTTSFLGIGLAFLDFLSDGCGVSKKGVGRILISLLIAAPTLFFVIYFEKVFLRALELSGGIGDSIISGLIPAAMIWKGRYQLSKKGDYKVAGGKLLLIFVCLFYSTILLCEISRSFIF